MCAACNEKKSEGTAEKTFDDPTLVNSAIG